MCLAADSILSCPAAHVLWLIDTGHPSILT
jgi:hypothetical protein